MQSIPNKIQLITYADSLGKNLKELNKVLDTHLKDVVGGIHILPFYPSSSDRGFSPLTHLKVDSTFGVWEDIHNISRKKLVMCDFIVNHISRKSIFFQDYLKNGNKSAYKDYFITTDKFIKSKKDSSFLERCIGKIDPFFHDHGIPKSFLEKIYRPRPGTPFRKFEFSDGSTKYLWCTFSPDQIDIDVENPGIKEYFQKIIANFAKNGIGFIRLDAVGYAIKRAGTNCFVIPKTFSFIEWLAEETHKYGISILPEVHSHYTFQLELAKKKGVDYIYDFALPLLVMQAIFKGNNKNLLNWIKIRPSNQITTLDTHDGLPVPDVEGLMSEEERKEVSEIIHANGGNDTMRASGYNSNNVDVYQINCTYFSALGNDDDAYIAARSIQFFVPGIPQVYYVGLLAGKNDAERLEKTGIGRDINRHAYSLEEIEKEVKRSVVKRLFRIMEFRNNYPAFNGLFSLKESSENKLILEWKKDSFYAQADIDLGKKTVGIKYFNTETQKEEFFAA